MLLLLIVSLSVDAAYSQEDDALTRVSGQLHDATAHWRQGGERNLDGWVNGGMDDASSHRWHPPFHL